MEFDNISSKSGSKEHSSAEKERTQLGAINSGFEDDLF